MLFLEVGSRAAEGLLEVQLAWFIASTGRTNMCREEDSAVMNAQYGGACR